MTKLLNATELENCAKEIVAFSIKRRYKGRKPKLTILVASDDKASEVYVNNKVKLGKEFGIDVIVEKFGRLVSNQTVLTYIDILNNDSTVDGIMVQLPLFDHLSPELLINRIHPTKDVDGLTKYNKSMLRSNNALFIPCTPEGVISLLQMDNVNVEDKNVVIVGRGETSGAPMSILFKNHNANVTVCHSGTTRDELERYIRHADIVVSCVGKRDLIEAEWFKEGSIAIGVGFSYDGIGRQHLDFDVDKVVKIGKAAIVTQRTNCTGKATIIALLCNVISAYLMQP